LLHGGSLQIISSELMLLQCCGLPSAQGKPFSSFLKELEQILYLARKMGVDYGEFDVLRDKDKRIYVVDVNNTPAGPPNGLPEGEVKAALERLVKSFYWNNRYLDPFMAAVS
jgi:hypothetical protein